MKLHIAAYVVLSTVLFSCLENATAIEIDHFVTNQTVQASGGQPVNINQAFPVAAIGNHRTFKATLTQGQLGIELEAGLGVLSHSQSSGVRGWSQVTWDGDINPLEINGAGLPSINFFQDNGTAFIVNVVSFDPGFNGNPIDISLFAYDASDPTAKKYSVATKTLNSSFSGNILFSFDPNQSDFTTHGVGGPADFSNIGALEFLIDGTQDQDIDITFDYIKTNGQCDLFPDQNGRVIDECGVCGGDNSSCLGCDNIPNSGLVIDQCGVCGGDGTSCLGCDGTINSGLELDQCGVCGGNGTSCLDCAGTPFGVASVDQCGVCGGDGISCVTCDEVNIFETQAQLDGLAKEQEFIVRAVLKLLGKVSTVAGVDLSNYISTQKKNAHSLQISNWILSWTLPSVNNVCENAEQVCISSSNASILTTYRGQALELKKIALKAIKKIKKLGGAATYGGKITQYKVGAETTYSNAMNLSHTVPEVNYACSF